MSEKKNQHLVPACYLRRFEADVSEIQKSNPNFSSGIYINDCGLTSDWKLRAVTHKTFTRSYFYNLPEDNPKEPLVENFLSMIEGLYKKYSDEIIEGNMDNENMSFMSYFVIIQFMRVEAFLESFQGSLDEVAKSMDLFDGGDKYRNDFKYIAKRQLLYLDLGYALYPHSVVIYNKTDFPFITSDNPVVRRQINVVDALGIFPENKIKIIESESQEFPMFFFPISPNVAYVSCEMMKSCEKLIYTDFDLSKIFYLNCLSIANSYKDVYSSVVEPIKGERQLSECLSSKCGIIIKIYTLSKRIVCKGSIENDDNYSISLNLDDLEQVGLIKNNEQISLVEVIKDGVSFRGMRNCKVSYVNYNNGSVTIESNVKLGI